ERQVLGGGGLARQAALRRRPLDRDQVLHRPGQAGAHTPVVASMWAKGIRMRQPWGGDPSAKREAAAHAAVAGGEACSAAGRSTGAPGAECSEATCAHIMRRCTRGGGTPPM